MNVNKRVNQIERKVSQKIDEMTLKNLEDLNVKIYEYFTPYADRMNEILMEVYSYPYMTIEQFEDYTIKINEQLEPFIKDTRDDILLKFSEEVVRKNKIMLSEAMEEMLNEFSKIGISYHRATLEHKKVFNSAVSRMQRYLNLNYNEVCSDLKEICRFSIDSMLDYNNTRVINKNEMENEEIEIEIVENNKLIKMTELNEVVEFLESLGFKKVRQTGSHMMYKLNGFIIPVPNHGKEFNSGLAYEIQRQAWHYVA